MLLEVYNVSFRLKSNGKTCILSFVNELDEYVKYSGISDNKILVFFYKMGATDIGARGIGYGRIDTCNIG